MTFIEFHDFHGIYGISAISMKTIENHEFPYVRGMQECIVMLVISTTFKVRGDIFLLILWKSWGALKFMNFIGFMECHRISGIPAISMEIIGNHWD